MAKLIDDQGVFKVYDIPQGEYTDISLDKETPWVQNFLNDLNNDVLDEDRENISNEGDISIEISASRNRTSDHMEYVLLTGKLEAQYNFSCVRCLKLDKKSLSREFNAGFIEEARANDPEYEDQTNIYLEGEERELFFFQKKDLHLRDFLHEQMFYVHDSYPLCGEQCKGLCPSCGIDRNEKDCGHSPDQDFSQIPKQ